MSKIVIINIMLKHIVNATMHEIESTLQSFILAEIGYEELIKKYDLRIESVSSDCEDVGSSPTAGTIP